MPQTQQRIIIIECTCKRPEDSSRLVQPRVWMPIPRRPIPTIQTRKKARIFSVQINQFKASPAGRTSNQWRFQFNLVGSLAPHSAMAS